MLAESRLPSHHVLVRVINVAEVNKSVSADSLSIEEKLGYKYETDDYPLTRYRIAVTEVLDCIENNNGKIIMKGNICTARPGGGVYPLRDSLLEVVFNGRRPDPQKSVLIGSVAAGSSSVPFLMDPDIMIRHVLVIGGTGTGKSWFRGVLMEKLKEKGIYQVNFDPLGEYGDAVRDLGGVSLKVGRDLKLPLWVLTPGQFYDLISDYIPTEFQRTIALEAFKEIREKRGGTEDLMDAVYDVSKKMKAPEETRENVVNRMRVFLDALGIVGNDDPARIADYLNKKQLVNFEFVGLNDLQRDYAVASIITMLYDFRSSRSPATGKPPIRKPVLVSIDEAHLYVPSGKRTLSREVIKNVLRYGRHVGLALMLITQLPSSMDQEAVEMPALKVIFAISHEQLRGIRFALSDLPDEILESIGKMERGKAIITGTRDLLRYSVLVDITPERRTRHGAPTPSFFEEG